MTPQKKEKWLGMCLCVITLLGRTCSRQPWTKLIRCQRVTGFTAVTLTHMNHAPCLLNSVCRYWKQRKTQAKRKTKCAPDVNWFLAMRFPIIQDMCVMFTVENVSFAFFRSVKNVADTFQLISCSENNRLKVHPETTSDVYSKPLIFVFFFQCVYACLHLPHSEAQRAESLFINSTQNSQETHLTIKAGLL